MLPRVQSNTHLQKPWHTHYYNDKILVSKETVVLRRCESETWKFGSKNSSERRLTLETSAFQTFYGDNSFLIKPNFHCYNAFTSSIFCVRLKRPLHSLFSFLFDLIVLFLNYIYGVACFEIIMASSNPCELVTYFIARTTAALQVFLYFFTIDQSFFKKSRMRFLLVTMRKSLLVQC